MRMSHRHGGHDATQPPIKPLIPPNQFTHHSHSSRSISSSSPNPESCVYLTEIQLSPQQNYRDLRSAYFVSYGALDFIERFSNTVNGAGLPPRGTIFLTVRPVMYVMEHGFALLVD